MSRDTDTAIRVENLTKVFRVPHEKNETLKAAALNIFNKMRYTDFQALKDVSFEVKQGEFFGIIGKNGSGKSTLLKIIAGIYLPSSGTIRINGNISPFLDLGVGFNPELTARENVFLGGAILGLSRKIVEKNFERIIEFSELEDFMDMKFKNFSSGMQVRLAFSLAIHAHAEILLMDEVLAVGDTNFQSKCIEEFNRHKKNGKTVILVTHDISVVQRYCDRAVLLRSGKISKIGKPDDVSSVYIQQNMKDEKERLDREEGSSGRRNSQSRVRISSVRILDDNLKEKQIFETGMPMTIHVDLESDGEEKVDLGGCVVTDDGQYIAGFSTRGKGLSVGAGPGSYTYRIPELPFLKGGYYINVALFDSSSFAVIDLMEKAKVFKVFSNIENKDGIVMLPPDWENAHPGEETAN